MIGLELAHQLQRTADHEGAIEHAEQASSIFDALGDPVAAGAAVAVRARALATLVGDRDLAITLTQERLDALRDREDAVTVRLELLRALIGAKFAIGAPIRDLCDEKARLAELAGDASEIIDSYLSLSLYYGSTGALSLSRSLMQAAANLAERGRDTPMRTRVLTNLTSMWGEEDMAQALAVGREAVQLSRSLGDAIWASNAGLNCVFALLLAGEWKEAEALTREVRPLEVQHTLWEFVECYFTVSCGQPWEPRPDPAEHSLAEEGGVMPAFRMITRALERASTGDTSAATLALDGLREMHSVVEIFDDFVLVLVIASDIAIGLGHRQVLRQLDELVDGHHPGTHSRGLRAVRAHHRALTSTWTAPKQRSSSSTCARPSPRPRPGARGW